MAVTADDLSDDISPGALPNRDGDTTAPVAGRAGHELRGRSVLRNISWNWVGMVAEAVTGFLLLPLLLSRLGEADYGRWILLGALAGYFQFLDFGLRSAIGRHVAHRHATDDAAGVNEVLSTALTMLCGIGCAATGGVIALSWFLPVLVEVPVTRAADLSAASLLVALNLGAMFISRAFDASLWGFQRFDLLNLVDIPATLLRFGLTWALVTPRNPLSTLAAVTLGVTVLTGAAKCWLSFRARRDLALSPRRFRRESAKELLGYGFWNFIISVGALTQTSVVPVMVGGFLGLAAVAPFTVAYRLVDYASRFIVAAAGVLAPGAAALHARQDRPGLRRLLFLGTRYTVLLSLFVSVSLAVLGGAVIRLWVGPRYGFAGDYVTVLAIGMFGAMSSQVCNSLLMGAARHRPLAAVEVLRVAATLAGCFVALRVGGLLGVCVAIAVPQVLFQGAVCPALACGLLNVGARDYFLRSVLPGVLWSACPAALLGIAVVVRTPDTWLLLVLYSLAFSGLYAGAVVLWLRGSLSGRRELAVAP